MKKLFYLFIAVTLVSCGGGQTFEAANGTVVTYYKKGNNDSPSDSLISYFLLKYETVQGKILFESTMDSPAPVKVDSNFLKNEGDFFEALGRMKVGDSIGYQISAADLFLENFKGRLPDSVAAEDLVNVSASFIKQVTMEEYQRKSIEMRRDQTIAQLDPNQMATDIDIIDSYLEENGIEANSTDAGVRYVITEQGNGPVPELGQSVQVNYSGRLLSGEYFDTSVEEVAKEQGLYTPQRQYQPYPIQIWASPVISGWHDGISQLNQGTKATLYIPSPMAYGPRAQGAIIKANSVLVFDVEIVEVE